MRRSRKFLTLPCALSLAGAALVTTSPAVQAQNEPDVTTRVVHGGRQTQLSGGTGETKPAVGPEAERVRRPVANRSLSSKAKSSRGGPTLSGIPAPNTAVTTASGATSFSGIDHYQQRYEVAGGNQWSLEPPDQALCVGGGKVVEAVNNAVAVYDATSRALLRKDSLNDFFGYPPEIDRKTGVAGPKQTTDPTCLYDPGTGRFFLTILTYDSDADGNPLPSGHNTLDTAVSSTGDPMGAWTISSIDATDDGTGGTPSHAGCPCLGDYPHIGVDKTGFYVTTNEYPWFTDGFVGAQIYAMSKAQLASGSSTVRVTQINTQAMAPGGNPGFTVWPAQSPTASQYATTAHGTEYFLSTNAAEEANGTGRSDQLLTWSLTNTSSLAGRTPALGVHVVATQVGEYAVPLPAAQKAGPVPLADCLNLTSCAKYVLGSPDRYKETERPLDSLDTRMQQVTYANGLLYGSHGTAVDVGTSQTDQAQQTGAAWYVTQPATNRDGTLTTSVLHQGRLATARNNVLMPTMGVRPDGSAVIGMTLAGADHYPGAAYADLTATGTLGTIKVLAEGVGPEDGFSGYLGFGGRPRWGDYGAAAVDGSGSLWLANEWIGQSCTFTDYTADPFGTCNGTRTALANWSTMISRVPTS